MKQNIILGIIIIALVACFAIYNNLNKKEEIEYFKTKGEKSFDNSLVEEYRILKNLIKKVGLKENMYNSKTYESSNILEYFNEEFFKNKKMAVVVIYEDNTREYTYGINKVIYNEDRTEATIDYHNKPGVYSGTFANVWYNYMFVELEPTVKNVKFVINNQVLEK